MQTGILDVLHEWPTWVIVVPILFLMLLASELGFRQGRAAFRNETDLSRTVSNAFKGSIFALVALLLGFSFSATTNRYDLRQRLVIDQANAVGTCHQRAGLLEPESRSRIRGLLRKYVDTRVELHREPQTVGETFALQLEIDRLLDQLWKAVELAYQREPDTVRNSLIIPAANEVCDLSSTRLWANRNHLPDAVLVLLLACVVISSLLLGHSSGQSGARHIGLWVASNVLFSLVLFVILDFDRPRRGLIRVDQTPMLELQSNLGKATLP